MQKPQFSWPSSNTIRALLVFGWLIVLGLFAVGVSLPMFTLTKLLIFDNTYSLLGGLGHMMEEGEWLLFVAVGAFSLIMPIAKLGMLLRLLWPMQLTRQKRWHFWLGLLGRWSMLDVFVVALLLVLVKFGALASVDIHAGLYLFCAAVICSMLLAEAVEQFAKRQARNQQATEPRDTLAESVVSEKIAS